MFLIDIDTGEVIASIANEKDKHDSGVWYTGEFINKLKKAREAKRRIAALHNHPEGYPPSADDFKSMFENGYEFGIVAGANGQVYKYANKSMKITSKLCAIIHDNIDIFFRSGYDIDRAYKEVLNEIELFYEVLR